VSEKINRPVWISLIRGGRVFARLRAPARGELRPGVHAVFRARYAGPVRGRVTARVTVRVGGATRSLERRYRIRL
jgi:hypothetical protein